MLNSLWVFTEEIVAMLVLKLTQNSLQYPRLVSGHTPEPFLFYCGDSNSVLCLNSGGIFEELACWLAFQSGWLASSSTSSSPVLRHAPPRLWWAAGLIPNWFG